jgi:MoaA/NifB/PqqE/SkfB family radical SAM enzyme
MDDRRAALREEIHARRTRLVSAPATINIELTGRCNFKPACTFCVGKNAPNYEEPGHMPGDQLARYWPDLLRSQRVNDCSYGETLLYPEFDTVVERLTSSGVRFGFTTNGLLLSERRARFLVEHGDRVELVVSLNAATRDTFWRLHGQNFGRIVGNVERFIQIHRALRPGRPVPLYLSFIVMRSNRHEVAGFLRLALRLGVERVILRHLFDLRVGEYSSDNFGDHFAYEDERLPYADYARIETEIRAAPEFGGLGIQFAWNSASSFIAQQAEEGVDIACLFPWKFLCVRPLHNSYAPCVYLKKSIAPPSATTIEEVWNGETMVGIRTALAAGTVADFCMTYGDACPIVLKRRAELAAPDGGKVPQAPATSPLEEARPRAAVAPWRDRVLAALERTRWRALVRRWSRLVGVLWLRRFARSDPRVPRFLYDIRRSGRPEVNERPRSIGPLTDACVALLCDGQQISHSAFVERCYERLLKRAPDEGGLRTAVEALEAGRSRARIVEAMLTSAEFRTMFERRGAGPARARMQP